jgi:hypothetical protein
MKYKWTGTKPVPAIIHVKGKDYAYDAEGVLTLPDGLDEFVAPEAMVHMEKVGGAGDPGPPMEGTDAVGSDEED